MGLDSHGADQTSGLTQAEHRKAIARLEIRDRQAAFLEERAHFRV
ncbi:MAG: hypothetical protein OEZ08_01970 [Betaproteobacteria bacterium]|nr:hypothetical protein [Betaproteobacteria bacterium]